MENLYVFAVVPHAGTWIEILYSPVYCINNSWSFPTRERGLKYNVRRISAAAKKSFPTRERGLKL